MKRALVHLLAGALVAAGSAYALAADPAPGWTGLRAGVGVVDATWHVGAGAGQYASDNIPTDASKEWDPNVEHVKQASSYGVASRLSMRAIVLQDGQGHAPVALLKVDNYLAQDYLTRRIAAILAADGSKVTYDNILMSATHNHNSPYYSTPSAGVWAFQDVMDLRMFEYQARVGAAAIEQAERSLVPARVGATTVQFPDFQGNIAGQDLDNDGAPAGYPVGVNDHGLVVMRFDKLTDSGWRPLATYVNYAEHGESLESTDLISEDWWAPFQRYVDRMTGVPVVFSQGSVGSAEGPYDRYGDNTPTTTDGGDTVYKIWAHMNFAQAERGTHLLAEKVFDAWTAIGSGDPSVQVPYQTDPVVDMLTHWVAGPLSHPYPSVGNCRTRNSVNGDPGVPAAGLPDCQRGDLGQQSDLYQNLKAAGLPLPDNYDATSFSTVEENLRIKLQAVRIGDTLLASCSCEAQSDLIKNLESRTDATAGNIYDGFDYANAADVADAWPGQGVQPCHAVDEADLSKGYDCPNPTGSTGQLPNWLFGRGRIIVSKDAFVHMEAEVHNDANGWNDPSYVAQANSEPTDPSAIKGNFTKTELGSGSDGGGFASCTGYPLSVGLGHTGDYDGYTVSYREYMARDAYRKALTSYGPHTADYMNTNLVAMAANLRCGTPLLAQPTDPLAQADEQRQATAAAALGQLSSFYYDTWSAQVPADGGLPSAVAQPKDVTRFDAAQFRWVGGDNWTDNPTVTVERQNADGTWSTYADQSGEVQVVLDNPATSAGDFGLSGLLGEQVDNRAGTQQWHWRASFEAFDSYPRVDVPGGQVPSGTYRFVVNGHFNGPAGTAAAECHDARPKTLAIAMGNCYQLASQPFTVSPWTGITVHDLRRDGTQASFVIDPYPRTPATTDGIAFYKDDPHYHVVCTTCTFRPWATTVSVVSAVVQVHRGNGTVKQVSASYDPTTQRWVATVPAGAGITVSIAAGGIRDGYGESNGQPVGPVS
jgi:hypothetical protein